MQARSFADEAEAFLWNPAADVAFSCRDVIALREHAALNTDIDIAKLIACFLLQCMMCIMRRKRPWRLLQSQA